MGTVKGASEEVAEKEPAEEGTERSVLQVVSTACAKALRRGPGSAC